MEPLLIILIPGLAGGLVLALLIFGLGRKPSGVVVPRQLDAPSPTLINMASIRVEGIGGLGLVAASLTVAVSDPRIRAAVILAGVLGVGLACLLIALRLHAPGLPGGNDPTDQSTLGLDDDPRRRSRARPTSPALPTKSAWTSA